MPTLILQPDIAEQKKHIISTNLDKTHIIADFDGTFTQYFDEVGKARASIISILRHDNILDEDYSIQAHELHATY